jgi:hypothetical protein
MDRDLLELLLGMEKVVLAVLGKEKSAFAFEERRVDWGCAFGEGFGEDCYFLALEKA